MPSPTLTEERVHGAFAVLSPAEIQAAKDEAWNRFMADYTGCVDDDPGTARARWWAEMDAIEALEEARLRRMG